MTVRGWRIAAASAIGTSHLKQGSACQDNHCCELLEDVRGNTVAVLVASDGAGSASRAADGSALTCRNINQSVKKYLADGGSIDRINRDLTRTWIQNVQSAIALQAKEDGMQARDYACTLLTAIVSEDAAAFLQIGDGAIVVSEALDEWCWIYWPQRGEFANTTYFVTDDSASERMDFDPPRGRIDEVALFTDGIESLVLNYGNKQVHDRFFNQMFVPVRALDAQGVDAALSKGLEKYLGSPAVCERTDDDKTLILATRRPVEVGEVGTA